MTIISKKNVFNYVLCWQHVELQLLWLEVKTMSVALCGTSSRSYILPNGVTEKTHTLPNIVVLDWKVVKRKGEEPGRERTYRHHQQLVHPLFLYKRRESNLFAGLMYTMNKFRS